MNFKGVIVQFKSGNVYKLAGCSFEYSPKVDCWKIFNSEGKLDAVFSNSCLWSIGFYD